MRLFANVTDNAIAPVYSQRGPVVTKGAEVVVNEAGGYKMEGCFQLYYHFAMTAMLLRTQ